MIENAKALRRDLHRWFNREGRTLPWRGIADPYAVLVSEFMLQQTTVAAVKPFFERWMRAWPDVESLAAASEDDVLKMWEGLGYYSRARNLLRAARELARRGRVPCSVEELRILPGIGPYTASAVAAFAFDQCVPVIDANIQRVLARLADVRDPVDSARGRAAIESAAVALLPPRGGARHTAALMDLGSMICKAGEPECGRCPVAKFCRAADPSSLPVKRPRPSAVSVEDRRVFALARGKICMVRSEGPRWQGLWLLPPAGAGGEVLHESRYAITHHRVRLEVVRGRPLAEWTPFDPAKLPAMPSPHRKAVEAILAAGVR